MAMGQRTRDEEEDVKVQKILEGAVTEWCGGRSF